MTEQSRNASWTRHNFHGLFYHAPVIFLSPLVRQAKSGCSRELKGACLEFARSSSSRLSERWSNPSTRASKGEDMSRKQCTRFGLVRLLESGQPANEDEA